MVTMAGSQGVPWQWEGFSPWISQSQRGDWVLTESALSSHTATAERSTTSAEVAVFIIMSPNLEWGTQQPHLQDTHAWPLLWHVIIFSGLAFFFFYIGEFCLILMSSRFQCLLSLVQCPHISWLGIILYLLQLSWFAIVERLVLFSYTKQGLYCILENTCFSSFGNFLLKLHGWLAALSLAQWDLQRHPYDFPPSASYSVSWESFLSHSLLMEKRQFNLTMGQFLRNLIRNKIALLLHESSSHI